MQNVNYKKLILFADTIQGGVNNEKIFSSI